MCALRVTVHNKQYNIKNSKHDVGVCILLTGRSVNVYTMCDHNMPLIYVNVRSVLHLHHTRKTSQYTIPLRQLYTTIPTDIRALYNINVHIIRIHVLYAVM
jgi:hypothetical protein